MPQVIGVGRKGIPEPEYWLRPLSGFITNKSSHIENTPPREKAEMPNEKYNRQLLKIDKKAKDYENLISETLQAPTTGLEAVGDIDNDYITPDAHSSVAGSWLCQEDEWSEMVRWEMTVEKNKAYQNTLQSNHTRATRNEFRLKRRTEKKLHRKKKRLWLKGKIENMEILSGQNETRKFYRSVNNARKPFATVV